MSLSYFSDATVADDEPVTSIANLTEILAAIQHKGADPYFTSIQDIGRVVIYFTHQDGRQKKRFVHDPQNVSVSWTTVARDGVWYKNRIRVFTPELAETVLEREDIGDSEDITHSSGEMHLNIS